MSQDKVIQRIAKLLRLAENRSASPNEAAIAAGEAVALMESHHIDIALIEAQGGEATHEPVGEEAIDGSFHKRRVVWKRDLASVIAKACRCRTYGYQGAIFVVAAPSDRDFVKRLYHFLVAEIDRLALGALCGAGIGRAGYGRTYLNNFRMGAVNAIEERLREMAAERRLGGVHLGAVEEDCGARRTAATNVSPDTVNKALAILDNRQLALDRYFTDLCKKLGLVTRRKAPFRADRSAYQAGQEAGRRIHLGAHLTSKESSKRLK